MVVVIVVLVSMANSMECSGLARKENDFLDSAPE